MKSYFQKALRVADANSPTIMSALAIGGLGGTVYLTVRGTLEAVERVEEDPRKELDARETIELVWDCFVPAALVVGGTAGCILMATRVGNRRAAAAQAALVLTERAYSEYRDATIQQVGETAERNIRDRVAENHIRENPTTLVVSPGKVICCELFTGRYFECDIESVRKAENAINADILHNDEATLDDFYYLVGLPPTQMSGETGWTSDRLLEITYSSVLTPDGKPCLAFQYNYVKNLIAS